MRASSRIIESIQAQPIWQAASVVLAYIPLATEVDILALLITAMDQGKAVGIPRCIANGSLQFHRVPQNFQQELVSGPYSLQEPPWHWPQIFLENLHNTTLILVPAYAYSPYGDRLGKGKGYYDRVLDMIPETCISMGVCFEKQIMQHIPTVEHDRRVGIVVTENHVYDGKDQRCTKGKC
jgi:5-formyltetrahydrofolate cyclo-ligase